LAIPPGFDGQRFTHGCRHCRFDLTYIHLQRSVPTW
jgi:hypothetical protein